MQEKEINKDNGDWLSAQQAVRPDGTEVTNLPLINKKLPPLVSEANPLGSEEKVNQQSATSV